MLGRQIVQSKVRFARASNLSASVSTTKNFINGVFEESKATKWFDVHNPATGEVVTRVPQSTPEELNRAVEGAQEAWKTWKQVPVQQRQVNKNVIYSTEHCPNCD
jgi:delta 1-pyrroline-5-carboxylate dehydrogenase